MSLPDIEAELTIGDLDISIRNIHDDVKKLRKELAPFQSSDLYFNNSIVYSTAAGVVNFIDLGHPAAGSWWQIRNLTIGGTDITQTPAGVGWVLIQANQPTNNPSLIAVSDWTKAALPQTAFYGTHELVCDQYAHVYVLITGGTNGQQYVASMFAEVFPEYVRSRL